MATDAEQTAIQAAWTNFAKSAQILFVPPIDDRPLDQYLLFRDAVFALVHSEQFLSGLNSAWEATAPATQLPPEARNALLLELQAFPLAVEVAQKTGKDEEKKRWWSKMLGRASTATGSVKDLVENLPPYVKSALTLFKELIDLFKGQD